MRSPDLNCPNCNWCEVRKYGRGKQYSEFICRLLPPVITQSYQRLGDREMSQVETQWPNVKAEDWCGKFVLATPNDDLTNDNGRWGRGA